jgi:hypothetical protein
MAYESGIWDASECALVLMEYQPEIIGTVFEHDRRLIELNVRALADRRPVSGPGRAEHRQGPRGGQQPDDRFAQGASPGRGGDRHQYDQRVGG